MERDEERITEFSLEDLRSGRLGVESAGDRQTPSPTTYYEMSLAHARFADGDVGEGWVDLREELELFRGISRDRSVLEVRLNTRDFKRMLGAPPDGEDHEWIDAKIRLRTKSAQISDREFTRELGIE